MTQEQAVALIVVDLQNGFFEDETLGQRRARLAASTNSLLEWARELNLLIVNVRTQHRRDRSTWTLNMLEDDQGFAMEGEPSAQPLAELDFQDCVEIIKTRDDAFFDTELNDLLCERGIQTIVLTGVSTPSCIATTTARAYAEDFHVVLCEDAIASSRPDVHHAVLSLLQDEFRFDVMTSSSITLPGSRLGR